MYVGRRSLTSRWERALDYQDHLTGNIALSTNPKCLPGVPVLQFQNAVHDCSLRTQCRSQTALLIYAQRVIVVNRRYHKLALFVRQELGSMSRVEKRRSNGSLPVAIGGAFATPPQSGLT